MNHDYLNKGKPFLLKRTGHISQFGGLKKYQFSEGKAKGVEAIDANTGTGFQFTVITDRCMDIALMSYKGVPISYMAKSGMVAPAYYDACGMNWLQGFFAGMLTTCGLANVGGPCVDVNRAYGREEHGLHGRIANTPAEQVCTQEQWIGDTLQMNISGTMHEGALHGDSWYMTRNIETRLGENRLLLHDVIKNETPVRRPIMILYHINIGYPVLDVGSRLLIKSLKTISADFAGLQDNETFDKFHEPSPEFKEHLYFHDAATDDTGNVYVAMINDELELGVYVKYVKAQLPQLSEWKMLSESEYVVGIEPGNCIPSGRTDHKAKGIIEYIEAFGQKEINIEIGLLTNKDEITNFASAFNQ